MPEPCTVLIAAAELLGALQGQFRSSELQLTFSDADIVRAIQTIVKRQPSLIVLERSFAATPRGTALIARIKADPLLDASEVRVMSHDGSYARTARKGQLVAVPPPPEPPAPALDQAGTRRAPRFRIRSDVDVRVDGNPVSLVDLSTLGAQLLSAGVLRPNQRVQLVLADGAGTVACRATVAWASFERTQKGSDPCYRAGVSFVGADGDAIDAFCDRNSV
jgi:hypothetical protein